MYVTAQVLYVTTGKYANPSIRCGATVSVILPVMPDVLDIVIVLQHINELLHILQVALIREGDVVLGHHGNVGGKERIALILQRLDHRIEIVRLTADLHNRTIRLKVTGTSLQRIHHDGVLVQLLILVVNDDDALLVKAPRHTALRAQIAVALIESMTDLGGGTLTVISQCVHNDSHAAGAIALVGDGLKVLRFKDRSTGEEGSVAAEEILIAPGVKPTTDLLHLENTDVTLDKRGYIETNEFLETAAEGIWALGDINGLAPFRHKANYEAEIISHNLFENHEPKDWRWARYDLVPAVTYTYPEAAQVGLTEANAKKAGYDVDIAVNHYSTAAKGYALGFEKGNPDDGFVKLVIDKKTKHLLGAHIIGHEASILIQPFINLMNAGLQPFVIRHEEIASPTVKKLRESGLTRDLVPQSIYTIGETMTPHPSLQEITMWTRYYYEHK